MRYVTAKYKVYQKELAYRFYIADSLFYQGVDKHLTVKLSELLKDKPVNKRTGDEIAQDIITRLNLKGK